MVSSWILKVSHLISALNPKSSLLDEEKCNVTLTYA